MDDIASFFKKLFINAISKDFVSDDKIAKLFVIFFGEMRNVKLKTATSLLANKSFQH